MDKIKLNEELVAIHEELGRAMRQPEVLDGPMLQSLRLVADDIERVLNAQKKTSESGAIHESPQVEASPSEPTKEELPRTLEALAEQFSVDHPETAALLSRMGYLLSNLGI